MQGDMQSAADAKVFLSLGNAACTKGFCQTGMRGAGACDRCLPLPTSFSGAGAISDLVMMTVRPI